MASGSSSSSKGAARFGNISPVAEDSSEESDAEEEPARSFHRRLSTNRDIRCSVCFRPGVLRIVNVLDGDGMCVLFILTDSGRGDKTPLLYCIFAVSCLVLLPLCGV